MNVHKGSLKTSPYHVTLSIGGKDITLYFTTIEKMNRFELTHVEAVEKANNSIMKVYKHMFTIDLSIFAIVRHYTKIENRGFYLIYDGVEYQWLNELKFSVNEISKLEN